MWSQSGPQRCRRYPRSTVEHRLKHARPQFLLADKALGLCVEVAAQWDRVADTLAGSFPKVADMMSQAKTDVLAFTAFPKAHWQKIWSNNPLVIWSAVLDEPSDLGVCFVEDVYGAAA